MGYNTTETLILSSGTIAGAIEGASWGLPALAFSQCIPDTLFEDVQRSQGHIEGPFAEMLTHSATHAASIAKNTLENPAAPGQVINVNFPAHTTAETEIRETFPAKLEFGSLFTEIRPGTYRFEFNHGTAVDPDPDDDRSVLAAGAISRSVLDFSRLGRR